LLAIYDIKRKFKSSEIDLQRVYYIGDLPSDIKCAKTANIVSIALLSGHGTRKQLKKSKPDILLEELEDLLKIDPFKKLLLKE
jgi:phosphoglycolate phosphatase-like HAD superfamily hydrolase